MPADAPLRIAYLSYRGKPHVGGQGVYTRHLSKALVDLGHTVEVLGGQPDDANGPMVWMIGDLDDRTGYCSGVVVSPHVVLTAGHCAAPKAKFEIFLGADYNDEAAKAAPENHVAVVSHHVSPDYDSHRNLHDVGVLVTATPIPRTPAVINREALVKADVGRPLRISGFGRSPMTKRSDVVTRR